MPLGVRRHGDTGDRILDVAQPVLTEIQLVADKEGRDAESAEEIEALIAGTAVIAFAHQEGDAGYDLDHVATRAERNGDDRIFTGTKSVIADAEGAAWLLVSARTSGDVGDRDGVSRFLVPVQASGLDVRCYPYVDGGRAAEVRLDSVTLPATALVGMEGEGAGSIADAVAAGLVALSAEALCATRRSTICAPGSMCRR